MPGALNRLIAKVSPKLALRREATQLRFEMLQARRSDFEASTYSPVGGGTRSKEFYRNRQDAQGALRHARAPLSFVARDMLRNNSRVTRANNLFAGYAIGSGIRPVVEMRDRENTRSKDRIEGLIRDHLLTTALDADGHSTLFGLQALSMKAIPISGEVLLRRRLRRSSDGLPLPFQIQCLETDFICADKTMGPRAGEAMIENGIEYGVTGLPTAYHLYARHPGSTYGGGGVRRVTAKNISHAFVVDRPGQRRGVSWYAPVMPELLDIQKFMQGTLKRQEVAAMFAGILTRMGDDDPDGDASDALKEIQAGGILELDSGDELTWSDPPSAMSAEPVVRLIDRVIASGLMLTYEGFTGDYSQVNYTSGRMGRMDQDPIIRFWQEELIIAKQMAQVGGWFKEAVFFQEQIDPDEYVIRWTAPRRPVVDPTKDFPALIRKVRGGLDSRQAVIREMGKDPAEVRREIIDDAEMDDSDNLIFDSDARRTSIAGGAQAGDVGAAQAEETDNV